MGEETEKIPGQWAVDLLRNPGIHKDVFYTDHLAEMVCTMTGILVLPIKNFVQSRPLYATPHVGVIGAVVGFAAGRIITMMADYRYAKQDAMIIDYIRLHPDRFPEPRNKKYADIFDKWRPIR